MKLFYKILIFIIIIAIGNPIRDYILQQFETNAEGTNYSQLLKSTNTKAEISIWGSSTAFKTLNAKRINLKTGKTCYNYGISGLYFQQLKNLFHYSESNTKTTIVWVINPFEFLKDINPKIDLENYYIPHLSNLDIYGWTKERSPLTTFISKNIGWVHLFHLNSDHWQLIHTNEKKVPFNAYGNIFIREDFINKNNFYKDDPLVFDQKKIELLNELAEKIAQENNLILLIPPNLKEINLTELTNKIKPTVLNFSNLDKDKTNFQDHIHVNPNLANACTDSLILTLEQ